MLELDVYFKAAFSFMAVGAVAGCIVWLVGLAVFTVIGTFENAG